MATQNVRPEPGALDRQHQSQRRRSRRRKAGALALAATLGVVAVVSIVVLREARDATTPAGELPMVTDAAPIEVATGFVEAYGALDADRALTYLADGVDIDGLVTPVTAQDVPVTREDLRLLISFLDAAGYRQMLDPCEEVSTSASVVVVRCPFDYHQLRSAEIGLGPFGGSYFDLSVRDGEIVRASRFWSTEGFAVQVWEPFAAWVSTTYPRDAEVMYQDETYSRVRLTEESIRLWERRSREYVRAVGPQ